MKNKYNYVNITYFENKSSAEYEDFYDSNMMQFLSLQSYKLSLRGMNNENKSTKSDTRR